MEDSNALRNIIKISFEPVLELALFLMSESEQGSRDSPIRILLNSRYVQTIRICGWLNFSATGRKAGAYIKTECLARSGRKEGICL